MTDSTSATSGPGVALLFEDANLSAHLREALIEAGARIVHEGPATQATREDLSDNGAEVVVVNLDAKVEEHLDALYDIFDESRQKVVFNDAEASSGLSGWDQARWARHLAAKLMDAHDVDPPRPAEALAVEAHPTEWMLPEDEMPDAPPEEAPPAEVTSTQAGEAAEGGADLTAELEALLAEDSDLLGRAEDNEAAGSRAAMQLDMGGTGLSDDDLDAIGAIPGGETASASGEEDAAESDSTGEDAQAEAAPAAEAESVRDESMGAEDTEPAAGGDEGEDSAFEETLRMFDQALAENEKLLQEDARAAGVEVQDPHAEAEKLLQPDDAVAGGEDASSSLEAKDADAAGSEKEAGPAEDSPALELADPDSTIPVAESARHAQAISEDAGNAYSLVDPDEDSPADPSAGEKKATPEPDAPDWGLVDYDDTAKSPSGMHIMQQNRKVAKVDPSEFGIEKVSASEYLAPEDEGEHGDVPIEPGMSLELEPIEQAMAPKMIEDDQEKAQVESFDASVEGHVRRVVVVAAGSSAESRASLRDFVAAVDRVPNAVLVGVVHQKAGDDLGALAGELNEASPILPVRVVGEHGKARHGEMLLVPAGKQAALQANGQLQMLDSSAQPMANPSIDLSMTLVAQEFGDNAMGIVLAGDAIDGLAGALAIRDAGGQLWAMDPADCNDNTMVAVIVEEQLADRTGSPQELAVQMLKEMS